jgi:hypothetical protein
MPVARRHRRLTLWLAMLAMVFAALAPTVSHALALFPGSAGWVEVCTAHGARWVAVDGTRDAQPGGSIDAATGQFDQCPFCHHAGQGMAPPPAAAAQALQPPLREGPPERFLSAPHTAHDWRAAQPRAPPLLS